MRVQTIVMVLFMAGGQQFLHPAWGQSVIPESNLLSPTEMQVYSPVPYLQDEPSLKIPSEPQARVQIQSLTNPSAAALRGNIILVFQADQTQIQVIVSKRDINVSAGADEFAFSIFDAFGEFIAAHSIPDDGNTGNNVIFGQTQSQQYTVDLPSTGLYILQTNTSRDLYYDIAVSPPQSAWIGTLEMLDGSKSIDLYFQAPTERVEFIVSTTHSAGFPQTLRIHDSNDQIVQRLALNEITTAFSLAADVPTDEVGKTWRLHIPKQDLVIQSRQVQYWFRSPGDVFDVAFQNQLLQLRVMDMAGIPGMRVPVRFVMENIRSTPVEVFPVFRHESGIELEIESYPASITIAPASRNSPFFYTRIPDTAIAGDNANYFLTLNDKAGNSIVSSKISVNVVEQKPLDPARQFLFFTPERLNEIRRMGKEGEPYQQSIYINMLANADRIVAEHLLMPDEASHWRGYYICDGIGDGNDDPNDGTGAPLIFDPLKPGVYICSLDGERYEGEQYRRGWIGEYYFEMFNRINRVGMAYHLEPKIEYAEYIKKLLIDIADRYRSYQLDDYLGNRTVWSARMMTETLGEAMGLTFILPAYDAVRANPIFSQADRAHIEWNFIRPAAQIIQGNLMDVTNWQSWHNTAIGLAGFLMDDEALIDSALHGPNGHDFVRNVAIREDGLWQEGSVGYHFFGMLAMNVLLEAMQAHGLEPFDEKIELAYSSILDIMQPDGKFPALNDSAADFIQFRASHYEIANAHYDNSKFDEILRFIYEDRGYGRGTIEALFYGKPYQSTPLQIAPTIKERMGLATLRSGTRLDDQTAMMDYGPHGQFHGHLDKLHVSLYGAGEEWLPDLGTGQTNTALYSGWFRTTLGHNTIMINEQPQGFDTETERPIRFYHTAFPQMQIMQSEFGSPVYPQGTNVRRTVISSGNQYSIIIDDVSGAQGPVDFVFHGAGMFSPTYGFEPLGGAPGWSTNSNGYRYLLPPIFRNIAAPSQIMQRTTTNPIEIIMTKEYGFTDGLETLEDWSGNINLSDDAVEGNTALSWVIVPREFQSIQKSFDVLGVNLTVPDRITFDYKIESTSFEFFTMQLTSLPDFPSSNWIVTSGAEITPNEWQKAEIDLTQPDFINGNNLQFKQMQFAIFNANQYEGSYKVYIDNIQAWKNGNVVQPEERKLRFLFPEGEQTQYFLANGPSAVPPRTHPVVIARRNGLESMQSVVAVLPEELNSNTRNIGWLSWIDENTLQFADLVADPLMYLNTDKNEYAAFNWGNTRYYLIAINTMNFENEGSFIHYNSDQPAELQAIWTFLGPDYVSYNKNNVGHDTLTLLGMPFEPIKILLDGEEFNRFLVDKNLLNTSYILRLFNLPQGEHKFDIIFDSFTDIPTWELY